MTLSCLSLASKPLPNSSRLCSPEKVAFTSLYLVYFVCGHYNGDDNDGVGDDKGSDNENSLPKWFSGPESEICLQMALLPSSYLESFTF